MPKYEIMLIIDPKREVQDAENITKDVFGEGLKIFKKMDHTELAYEIKKTKTASYVLMQVETTGDLMAEFIRKINITKYIWRNLIINLDSEKGLNRKAKPKRVRVPKKRGFGPRRGNLDYKHRGARQSNSNDDRKRRTSLTIEKKDKGEKIPL